MRDTAKDKKLEDPRERNGFVDQHDGDISPDRIEVLFIRTNKRAFDLLSDCLTATGLKLTFFDLPVDLFDQRRVRNRQVLLGLGAAQNGKQFTG